MRYVSIDIETLGLDPETCDIIEFGAVIDDTSNQRPLEELPRFHCYVTHDVYRGQPYAMWMNAEILKNIATKPKTIIENGEEIEVSYCPADMLDDLFAAWLQKHDIVKPIAAGKNFQGFDLPFLKKIGFGKSFTMHHRSLDPGSMFFDAKIDSEPPSLHACMERAGIIGEVQHTAIADALDVIKCIRFKSR